MMPILILTVSFCLTACQNHMHDKLQIDKTSANGSSTESQKTNSVMSDTLTMPKEELTKIYTQAIAEFIKAAYKNDKTTFDTLFFGKHIYGQPDDFPEIELPETIEKTQIRLVLPEIGQKKQSERKSLVYINMMGWVDKEKAEFLLVVFSNGAEHQYDYFINFSYNTSGAKFELVKVEFENYLHLNGQKSKRITLYKNDKYVDDK
jgi:hypothetical protein